MSKNVLIAFECPYGWRERKRQKQLLSWMVEWVVLPKIAVTGAPEREARTLVRKVFGV